MSRPQQTTLAKLHFWEHLSRHIAPATKTIAVWRCEVWHGAAGHTSPHTEWSLQDWVIFSCSAACYHCGFFHLPFFCFLKEPISYLSWLEGSLISLFETLSPHPPASLSVLCGSWESCWGKGKQVLFHRQITSHHTHIHTHRCRQKRQGYTQEKELDLNSVQAAQWRLTSAPKMTSHSSSKE